MSITYNVDSAQLRVFPLAKNRPVDRSARLFYEHNVANLTKQLIDTSGFLIEPNVQVALDDTDAGVALRKGYFQVATENGTTSFILTAGKHLIFNLGGYYFDIGSSDPTVLLKYTTTVPDHTIDLYVSIQLDANTKEIDNQDDNNFYKGLTIHSGKPETGYTYALKIATINLSEKDSEILSVVFEKESFVKFSTHSTDISINVIDGKHDI